MTFPKFPPALAPLAAHEYVMDWLKTVHANDRADNTVKSYAFALHDYIKFSQARKINYIRATTRDVRNYMLDLKSRPLKKGDADVRYGLSKSSQRQWLTALRLFYNYLVLEDIRKDTPFKHKTSSVKNKYRKARRTSSPQPESEAWIPDDAQWNTILDCMREESLRNKVMLAISYECALRKGELCKLKINDINGTIITLRPETTKNQRGAKVEFSDVTRVLLDRYLATRPDAAGHKNRALFISESTKNWAQPITDSTWTKVIEAVAERAQLPQFTPHTLRHLGISHFARQGWEHYKVTKFARHQSPESTGRYLHLGPEVLYNGVEQALANLAAF